MAPPAAADRADLVRTSHSFDHSGDVPDPGFPDDRATVALGAIFGGNLAIDHAALGKNGTDADLLAIDVRGHLILTDIVSKRSVLSPAIPPTTAPPPRRNTSRRAIATAATRMIFLISRSPGWSSGTTHNFEC